MKNYLLLINFGFLLILLNGVTSSASAQPMAQMSGMSTDKSAANVTEFTPLQCFEQACPNAANTTNNLSNTSSGTNATVLIGTSFTLNNDTMNYIKNHTNDVKAMLTRYVNSSIENIAKGQSMSSHTLCIHVGNLPGCFFPGIIIWCPGHPGQLPPCNYPPVCSSICITSIRTVPSLVKVNDTIRLNVTVSNHSPGTVSYTDVCRSPVSATFNNKVSVTPRLGCLVIGSKQLGPGQTATILAPPANLVYKAISPGIAHSKVTFSYIHGAVPSKVSKAFAFNILP